MNANQPNTHTPLTLIHHFSDAFRLEPADHELRLKGIYRDRRRHSHEGFYYDRLKDERNDQIVTIKVPESIKARLVPGQVYLLKGSLEKDVRSDGVIEPVFVVAELVGQIESRDESTAQKAVRLVQRKEAEGKAPIDKRLRTALYGEAPPRLAVVTGVTSVACDAMLAGMGRARNRYKIEEHRVNLMDVQYLVEVLQALDQAPYTAITIMCSGAPGLEIFDNLTLAETALGLDKPLITALGHAQEITLLEKLADKPFPTPTALGNYLLMISEHAREPTPPEYTTDVSAEDLYTKLTRLQWVIIVILVFFIIFFVLGPALFGG